MDESVVVDRKRSSMNSEVRVLSKQEALVREKQDGSDAEVFLDMSSAATFTCRMQVGSVGDVALFSRLRKIFFSWKAQNLVHN